MFMKKSTYVRNKMLKEGLLLLTIPILAVVLLFLILLYKQEIDQWFNYICFNYPLSSAFSFMSTAGYIGLKLLKLN